MERRKRRRVVAGAVTATLIVGGAVGLGTMLIRNSTDDRLVANQPTPATGSHQVTVITSLEGPSVYYFEGAFTQVTLKPTESTSDTQTQHRSGPQNVGQTTTWSDVTEGSWRLTASTLVCNGNCGNLAPATDTCTLDLDVTHDTTVLVSFMWGQVCLAEVLAE